MNKDDLIAKLGPCELVKTKSEYDDIVHSCNDPRSESAPDAPVFLGGKLWTWGYFPPGVDPREIDHDWNALAAAVELARELEKTATEAGLYQSSEADVPYQALVVKMQGDVKASMGMDPNELDERVIISDPAKNLFFTDDALDEGLEEYFGEDDIEAFKTISARMHDALKDVRRITFDSSEVSEGLYTVSPEIYVGELNGYLVGLWSYIVRT